MGRKGIRCERDRERNSEFVGGDREKERGKGIDGWKEKDSGEIRSGREERKRTDEGRGTGG